MYGSCTGLMLHQWRQRVYLSDILGATFSFPLFFDISSKCQRHCQTPVKQTDRHQHSCRRRKTPSTPLLSPSIHPTTPTCAVLKAGLMPGCWKETPSMEHCHAATTAMPPPSLDDVPIRSLPGIPGRRLFLAPGLAELHYLRSGCDWCDLDPRPPPAVFVLPVSNSASCLGRHGENVATFTNALTDIFMLVWCRVWQIFF